MHNKTTYKKTKKRLFLNKKVLKKEQADGQPTYIYTSAGENKCVYASIENVGTDYEEIKAIIESVKIK